MKVLDVIKTANRNLARAKLRTFLTISAIFVGAFTLTLTTALGSGAQDYLQRQLGNVEAPGVFYVAPKFEENPFASSSVQEYNPDKKQGSNRGESTLTVTDIEKLQTVQGTEYAKPYYSVTAEYVSRDSASKKYTPGSVVQYTGLSLDLAAGSLITDEASSSVILPENYVSTLGFSNAQDAIGKKIIFGYKNLLQELIEEEVTVVGVMKKSFIASGQMYMNDDLITKIAEAQGQGERYLAAFVKFKDASGINDEELKKRITDVGAYSAISYKEQINTISTIISTITAVLNVVGIIALFAASFGIINTLLMSVYERTQEIGLMKALGTHRRAIFSLFAFEAILVGFWGSLVAVAAGYGVSQMINTWATSSFLKDFEGFTLLLVSPMNALMVVGLIVVIAFLAGALPAIKASRLNPIEALRSE